MFHPDTAHKMSANLYDIYHCCVYSEKLLMMDKGTVRKYVEFCSKNKFEKLVHLVGFIIRTYTIIQIQVKESPSADDKHLASL